MAFIEGYADRTSLSPGETLGFHVSTDAPAFRILVSREGLDTGAARRQERYGASNPYLRQRSV
jgi:hypothetical protein